MILLQADILLVSLRWQVVTCFGKMAWWEGWEKLNVIEARGCSFVKEAGKLAAATRVWGFLSFIQTPGKSLRPRFLPSPFSLQVSITDLHGTGHRLSFNHARNMLWDFRGLMLTALQNQYTDIRNIDCSFQCGYAHFPSIGCKNLLTRL